MKQCDLHIHSNYSDSDADIESIFKGAKEKGLGCIAITDHDTVEGLAKAHICSKEYDIELIDAIELSAEHQDAEIHILGYFIDINDENLQTELKHIKNLRIERLTWMADQLNSLGVGVDKDELFAGIKIAVPTRLHLALYLQNKGKVTSLRQAFKKYLSPGSPAYRSRFKYSVKEAIKFIHACKGLAFLAHPHVIPNQAWVEEFISLGIDGLEVVYPNMPPVKRSMYENMIIKSGLLKSGGSDVHGSYKEYTRIGEVTIPYSWVEEMKKRR